eukprot:gene30133-35109_t
MSGPGYPQGPRPHMPGGMQQPGGFAPPPMPGGMPPGAPGTPMGMPHGGAPMMMPPGARPMMPPGSMPSGPRPGGMGGFPTSSGGAPPPGAMPSSPRPRGAGGFPTSSGGAPPPGMAPPGAFPPGGPPPGPQMGFGAPPGGYPRPPGPGMNAPPAGMPQPGMAPPGMRPGMPPPPGGMPPPPGVGAQPPRPMGGMGMPPPVMPGFQPAGHPGMPPPPGGGMPHPGHPGMPPGPPGMGMGPPPGAMGMPPGPHGMGPGPPGMGMAPSRAPGGTSGGGGLPPPPMGGGYDPYQAQRMAASMVENFESLTLDTPSPPITPLHTLNPHFQRMAASMVENFESLTLGAPGPGMPDGVDLAALPRPTGDQKEKALAPQPVPDPSNCRPNNMRLTVNGIPSSSSLRTRWSLPVGVVVHPMSDEKLGNPVPLVNLGSAGIVRCRRCRTYINPFVLWSDAGRRYKCNVCVMLNEVPPECFCDHNGQRKDLHDRPELASGTVEYIAPAEYMVRPPMPPVFFFVIDVSHTSCGVLAAAVGAIKASLDSLPGDERAMVGLITFDSAIHFYNLKSGLTAPQMMVVTELEDPFIPLLPEDLLVNLAESRELFDTLLDSLPSMYAKSQVVDSCMGPALKVQLVGS